jgi:hypothetical protein
MTLQQAVAKLTQMPPDILCDTLSKANAELQEIDVALRKLIRVRNNPVHGLGCGWIILIGIGIFMSAIAINIGAIAIIHEKSVEADAETTLLIIALITVIVQLVGFVMAVAFPLILNKRRSEKNMTLHKQKESETQTQTEETINRISNQIFLIPPKYRYPLALETMIELIHIGRADSWEKCADKYEEQYHRWVVEHGCQQSMILQQQTLAVANSAKASSAAAAIFSGVAAVTGIANFGRR